MNSILKLEKVKYFILVALLFLLSCGGGGGTSPTASQPNPTPSLGTESSSSSSSSSNYKVILESVKLNSSDVIAQLSPDNTTTSYLPNFYKNFLGPFRDLIDIFLPNLVAQNSLNPVDLSTWNRISKKLENGTITDIQTTYIIAQTDDSGQIMYQSDQGFKCTYDPTTGIYTSLINTSTNQIESYSLNPETGQVQPLYSDEAKTCGIVEVTINCDTSNLPIHILKARVSDEKNKHLIAKVEYVSGFNIDTSSGSDSATCIPIRATGLIYIQNEKVYNISDVCIVEMHVFKPIDYNWLDSLTRFNEVDYFVPANSPFNKSDKPIISRNCGNVVPAGNTNARYASLSTMELTDYNVLRFTPISNVMEVKGGQSTIVFDGTYLLTLDNNKTNPTIYKHKVGETGFSIITPDEINYGDPNTFTQVGLHLGYSFTGDFMKAGRNGYTSMVFYGDDLLIFGDHAYWGHKYNIETDEITPLVDTWPRIISTDGTTPTMKDYSHCPDGQTTETELRSTGKTDCMESPKAKWLDNGFSHILGTWNQQIIFNNVGSWDPSSFLHSGHIICAPVLPVCDEFNQNYPTKFFDFKDNFMYAINQDKNYYVRYDMNTRTSTAINLNDYGYLAEWYEVTKDSVYVTVTDSSDSSKAYVDVDFANNTVNYIGKISDADRTVVEIFPIN